MAKVLLMTQAEAKKVSRGGLKGNRPAEPESLADVGGDDGDGRLRRP
jgi:hypothetical protein